jgi:hypothetical protein
MDKIVRFGSDGLFDKTLTLTPTALSKPGGTGYHNQQYYSVEYRVPDTSHRGIPGGSKVLVHEVAKKPAVKCGSGEVLETKHRSYLLGTSLSSPIGPNRHRPDHFDQGHAGSWLRLEHGQVGVRVAAGRCARLRVHDAGPSSRRGQDRELVGGLAPPPERRRPVRVQHVPGGVRVARGVAGRLRVRPRLEPIHRQGRERASYGLLAYP